MKNILTLCTIFLMTTLAWSQSSKQAYADSLGKNRKSEVRVGLRYSSDYLYMGRSDSLKAPYLTPSVGYYHKSGFFVRSHLSYLTAKDQGRIDMYGFSGGYEYYGEKLALGLSLSEYIFNDASYVVQAEMNTYVNAYAGYDFEVFMLFADAGAGFSDATDIFLTFDISRMFYTLRNKLLIMPSLSLNMGTQRYYDQYYQYRSPESGFGQGGNGKGKDGQQQPPTVTVNILESDKFQILDYEASLQLTYKLNRIRLFSIATWTFPVNPATVVVDNVTREEDLKNNFYWTTGIRLTLSGK